MKSNYCKKLTNSKRSKPSKIKLLSNVKKLKDLEKMKYENKTKKCLIKSQSQNKQLPQQNLKS